jgi:hypothetical protein
MKKQILFTSLMLSFTGVFAQWCVPTTAIPYDADMPGITHFVLNTIDRASADLEHYPNNSYVNTGMSTDLHPGQTYSVSITFTIDATICPDMNLRVWIDYNGDYQLDDAGETVISANNQLPGTYTGSFTVPANSPLISTRLRVTAKMSPNGGHTLPTPCDSPPDPFGYHGEIEDYDVNITSTTGIENQTANSFSAFASEGNIHFVFNKNISHENISLVDLQGKTVANILNDETINSGTKLNFDYSALGILAGIYLAVLTGDENKEIVRLVLE